MKIFLCLVATIQLGFGKAKIGVMETAFGLRCSVESVRLAKESGYSGVQIHTGRLEKNGQMTISNPTIQKDFLKASKTHGVEIFSLCAGAMNRIDVTKPGETRKKGRAIMLQSLEACHKLHCKILLFPFFGPSNFQQDDEKLKGVANFIREILPIARKHGVTIGIESPVTFERVMELFEELDNPKDLQMYYDTGNMGRKNEDINKALKTLGGKQICEIHLKPKKGIHFGNNDSTDLEKLAKTLDEIGYGGWLVFEQGGGVEKGKTELSKENLKGVRKLAALREKG
ncbi:MAG: sugar phosphate isomerase/epimerase family protein [Akkermansiaceae bacterium]